MPGTEYAVDDLPWSGTAALLVSTAAVAAGAVLAGAAAAGLGWLRWWRR